MKYSRILFMIYSVFMVLLLLTSWHTHHTLPDSQQQLKQNATLVGELQLTDLALFTEARYTRHLSQSDLFSAFQDHPMAFEHFPSGSLTHPIAW